MRKRFFTTVLAGAAMLGALAESGTIEYTYAEGNLGSFGKGKKETIDVAICINDPGLAGMKVTGFKAYINATDGLSATSLWMTKELKIESKVNIPDIASFDVTPRATTFGGQSYGLMEVTLPEPYTLTGEPLYLGYTMTVDELTPTNLQYPVIISKGVVNPNGFWLHMSKSILKWLDYSETAGGVAFISVTLQGDLQTNSLGIASYEPIYAMLDEDFSAELNVMNIGVSTVNSVKYTYSFDNSETVYEGSATLPTGIEPAIMATSPITLEFENPGLSYGRHDLTVEITEVNGLPNESSNKTVTCRMDVIPFLPKHRPLMEEYTGLWCGWCTGGYLAMEMIAEKYGDDQVSICYHNEDPMAVTANYPMNVDGFPNGSIDRTSLVDPYYGSSDGQFGIALDLENAMEVMSLASIDVRAYVEGVEVTATSSVRFIKDMEDTNYQVGYVLLGNDLMRPEWVQKNYYSGRESAYKGTPLEVLTTWPEQVRGLVFNDVAIDVTNMMGVKGSIPSTIVTNEEYVNTVSFNIADNSLAEDKEKLTVAAYIIDKNTGFIVNANKCGMGTNGVADFSESSPAVATEYYDLTGRRVIHPDNGIFIRLERLSNGSSRTSKVILTK